jgi:hypothetical protein
MSHLPLKSPRQLMLDAFRQLPEDVSWDEIMETARFVVAVQQAIEEADRGEPVPLEIVQRRLKEIRELPNK